MLIPQPQIEKLLAKLWAAGQHVPCFIIRSSPLKQKFKLGAIPVQIPANRNRSFNLNAKPG
jgi:hypothetical protein